MANNSNEYSEYGPTQRLNDINEILKHEDKLRKDQLKKLYAEKKRLEEGVVESTEVKYQALQRKLHDQKIKDLEAEGKTWEAIGMKMGDQLSSYASKMVEKTLTDSINKVDSIITDYISKQQTISAHLVGSGVSLTQLTDTLNGALSSTTLVRQSEVYSKLYELVSRGIIDNVEQRAFLQTLADDIDITFDAANSSLTRLVRLQGDDITANRLAIEYSLQSFLNSNYQTSEYIKDLFTGVSESLLTSQSLMTSSTAMNYETMVQSWLGSYYSAGVSSDTVSSLAKAINAIGSGDISGLGNSGIQNLLLMGASLSGTDFSRILNSGITSADVNSIMTGVTEYLGSIWSNSSSNVVRSQLSSLFGIDISDLRAMANLNSTTGGVTSNIYDSLFEDYSSLVPFAKLVSNSLNNALFTWGTSVGDSPWQFIPWEVEKLISQSGIGDIISTAGSAKGGLSGRALTLLGEAINYAPFLSLFTSGAFSDIISSVSNFGTSNSLSNIFDLIGAANNLGSTINISGNGVSVGATISNGETGDMTSSMGNSMNDFLSTQDITGSGEDTEKNVSSIKTNVENIYNILDEYFSKFYITMGTISDNVDAITRGV